MVKVIDYKQRINADGKPFFTLQLQGDVEFIQSATTGNFYATARTCSITSTFSELVCQSLIGKEMPGRIDKVICDPYEFVVKETGEVINLTHRYTYVPEEAPKPVELTNKPFNPTVHPFLADTSIQASKGFMA